MVARFPDRIGDVRMPAGTIERIDEIRGDATRSEVVRSALLLGLSRLESVLLVDEDDPREEENR